MKVVFKRDAWLQGFRIRKGKDGAPVEVPSHLLPYLPSDAVVIKPGQALPPEPKPFGAEVTTLVGHDLGFTSGLTEQKVRDEAEDQRQRNLQRLQENLAKEAEPAEEEVEPVETGEEALIQPKQRQAKRGGK